MLGHVDPIMTSDGCGVDMEFPGIPYPVQQALMREAYAGMSEGGLSVLESGTGSGKSLSLLCTSLAWLRDMQREVITDRILQGKDDDMDVEKIPIWAKRKLAEGAICEATEILVKWEDSRKASRNHVEALNACSSEGNRNTGLKRKLVSVGVDITSAVADDWLLQDSAEKGISSQIGYEPNLRVQVYVCSRTHSQLGQLIRELRKIKSHQKFTSVTLGSRSQLCVHPLRPSGGNSIVMNDFCRSIVDSADGCQYRASRETLRHLFVSKAMDIEEMCQAGTSQITCGCAYFASREIIQQADLVFVPYSSIINDATRESLGIELKGNIVIIDEAHNILDAVNNGRSTMLTLSNIDAMFTSLGEYSKIYASRLSPRNLVSVKQIQFVVKRIRDYAARKDRETSDVYNFVSESGLRGVDLSSISRFIENTQFCRKLRGFSEGRMQKSQLSGIYSFTTFLSLIQTSTSFDRIIIKTDGNEISLLFAGIDAETQMSRIVASARAVLLIGGTMEPIDEFRAVASMAGVPFRSFSGQNNIDQDRIFSRIVSKTSRGGDLVFNRENRFNDDNLATLLEVVIKVCSTFTKGGIVVFVPSYEFCDRVRPCLALECKKLGRTLMADGKNVKPDLLFSNYKSSIDTVGSAVLLSVINGSLSEGIDFKDQLCRCVILVGLPYPNIGDIVLRERMSYFDHQHKSDPSFPEGRTYYEGRCMKAINQSIGRAIRHIGDWSSIILLDKRYEKPSVRSSLSSLIRGNTVSVDDEQTFWRDLQDFYDRWNMS